MPHTLLFLQLNQDDKSKTWGDYDNLPDALDGMLRIHEQVLKKLHPGAQEIQYDYRDLCRFIDELKEFGCLIYDPKILAYTPHDKKWLKDELKAHLKKLSQQ
eukprot:comp21489_c0_seq1/m.29783 comp21489_c0_seq1/g.29783  ORF comp21489_c0_seq1/g.29783 comp21489_c0_seq1/m.29783 type:complete len:102 (-) comp21489_c0_seq1:231-536(-)